MLTITSAVYDLLSEDAEKAFPDEGCGFLFGTETGEDRNVLSARPVDNSKDGDKRRRFEISPADYLRAEQFADANGLLLLGIYHSHPNHPSVPSEHDRIAAQPFFSYIIVSVNERKFNSLQSWRLNDQFQFEEEIIIQAESLNPINK